MLRILKIRSAHVEERRPYPMAIYHFSAKTISRAKGQSATASSAYRSGEELYSERYGYSNYYPREVQPVTFILKPEHAPEWTLNRERLWNEVEKVEKQRNSQLAREFVVALPNELSNVEQDQLIKEYVQKNFVDRGMVADVAIHRDDKNNPHAHIMTTLRSFKSDGTWARKQEKLYVYDENMEKVRTAAGNIKSVTRNITDWNDKESLLEWRKNWADSVNNYLAKNDFSIRISEKSYQEQGEDKIPTIHEGYAARQMNQRGEVSDRVERNKVIRQENYKKQKEITEQVKQELSIQIVQSYSPKEKIELKQIAKNLNVFVDYDNLLDKERMVRNWERAEKTNELIKADSFDPSIFEKIDDTKESIERGKELVENHAIRIFEKYYPEIKKQKFSRYSKINIGLKTLKEDRILPDKELETILDHSLNNEVRAIIKSVSYKNYSETITYYEKRQQLAEQKLTDFYKEQEVDKDTLYKLSPEEKTKFIVLSNQLDFQSKTVELLEKTYDESIHRRYPTADLTLFNKGEKEELARAIDYYGNTLSYSKLVQASQEQYISKYNTYEQKMGIQFIHQLENGTLTDEALASIQSNYRTKEIFETISDPVTRELFLNEVASNEAISDSGIRENISSQNLLGNLLKNTNIYNDLLRASQENIQRSNETARQTQEAESKSVQKKKKAKKSKKQEQSRTPSL